MSDTPRTDAAVSFVHCVYSMEKYPNDIPIVSKGFAQQLEREVAALDIEAFLLSRIEWLSKEAHGGGDWEHLNTRRDECAYILEELRFNKRSEGITGESQL